MSKTKIGIPQGTRDFDPDVVRKRYFIIDTIRSVFELYGFQPLETPAMENLETLLGKYGEEGDKLIFKILNNGLDRPEKREPALRDFEKVLEGKNVKEITERALRYDLTIPFARYVAMNHGRLHFPFKRYQVQPVWRADRPQKGRYREFYQCDADVVGSTSLVNEVELAGIYHEVFTRLRLSNYELRVNSRKLLTALADSCDATDKFTGITTAIDKLDKIGHEKVGIELGERGLNEHQVTIVMQYLDINGDNHTKINKLKELFGTIPLGDQGIEELEYLLDRLSATHEGVTENLQVDLTLARGLDYYTGIIFEAKAPANVTMGSIGGGGRYDDLTGSFGVPGIPGVGISFGVDRIYDVMEELALFPPSLQVSTQVLFFNLGEEESKAALGAMQRLRARGIRCEIYHETARFDKQFKYAEKKNIPYAALIGATELQERTCTIRNLTSGEQYTRNLDTLDLFSFID